ncbi:MAG: NusG domain II-containing protein [Pseudoflavonifractor sp.]
MKKRDIIIIAVVLALAGGLFLLKGFLPGSEGPKDLVVISLGSEVYKEVPLDEPQVIHIDQGGGAVNDIEITADGRVFMKDSTCDGQDCVKQGEMTAANVAERPLGGWIVCLPHQIAIELRPAAEEAK